MTPLLQILDLARWAPSGDNTQPWRFEIKGDDAVAVHAYDTRDSCVYDLDGHASQVSVGALLESIVLAATRFGLRATFTRRAGAPDTHPVFDVRFVAEPGLEEDPRVACMARRTVQRRPLERTPLTAEEKRSLEAAVKPDHGLAWFEGQKPRRRIALLNYASAKIRLTIPEAYRVHRSVIAWDTDTSVDRVPAGALGASPASLRLMRWAMASWGRVAWLNRYGAGTVAPRIELDLVPGLRCAAHVVIVAPRPPQGIDDHVAAGRALQRFWLTATRLGLQFQPEYTPLVFARYAREGVAFTGSRAALSRARRVAARLDELLGPDVARRATFLGRIGHGPAAHARSLRLPLEELLLEGSRPSSVESSKSSSSSARSSA